MKFYLKYLRSQNSHLTYSIVVDPSDPMVLVKQEDEGNKRLSAIFEWTIDRSFETYLVNTKPFTKGTYKKLR